VSRPCAWYSEHATAWSIAAGPANVAAYAAGPANVAACNATWLADDATAGNAAGSANVAACNATWSADDATAWNAAGSVNATAYAARLANATTGNAAGLINAVAFKYARTMAVVTWTESEPLLAAVNASTSTKLSSTRTCSF